jgi:predicted small metal-binding protein
MYEFQCGSPVCHGRLACSDKEELMRRVTEHVRTAHRIPVPTASILGYLEATAVTEVAPSGTAG